MEKKLVKIISIMLLFILTKTVTFASAADTVTLNELIESSQAYDGQVVIVQGEVLLEAMERGSNAWININDGTNAMGIFMPVESVKAIQHYGDYHTIGDTIQIEAQFNRSCKIHGGDMDLHFINYIAITQGMEREVPVMPYAIWIAIGLTIVTFGIIVYYMHISGQFERLRKIIDLKRTNK